MNSQHQFTVIKTFEKLPVAHCQFQDKLEDGSPGICSSLHGYSRSVIITIAAKELDPYGWVFPFGAFKAIRSWLEFYFDHTSIFPANDPRMDAILSARASGITGETRLLPYGVSMEMSSLFLYENANHYVYEQSDGRAAITKIEFREHSSNAGDLSINLDRSIQNAMRSIVNKAPQLVKNEIWEFEAPSSAIARIL